MPVFSPASGDTFKAPIFVTIVAPDLPNDGTIFYTTDATIPTHASTVYVGPFQLGVTATVFAVASAPGCADTPPGVAAYTYDGPGE